MLPHLPRQAGPRSAAASAGCGCSDSTKPFRSCSNSEPEKQTTMPAHSHDHEAHDQDHGREGHQHGIGGHQHAPASFGKAFAIGIALNLAYVVGESSYGVVAHSLALLADAGHNLGDVLGLACAWLASMLSKRR